MQIADAAKKIISGAIAEKQFGMGKKETKKLQKIAAIAVVLLLVGGVCLAKNRGWYLAGGRAECGSGAGWEDRGLLSALSQGSPKARNMESSAVC